MPSTQVQYRMVYCILYNVMLQYGIQYRVIVSVAHFGSDLILNKNVRCDISTKLFILHSATVCTCEVA
jgi:hypothetical protein